MRKLFVLICLLAVFLVALSAASPAMFWAIVVTLLLFFAPAVLVREREIDRFLLPASPHIRTLSSRAPPVL